MKAALRLPFPYLLSLLYRSYQSLFIINVIISEQHLEKFGNNAYSGHATTTARFQAMYLPSSSCPVHTTSTFKLLS